MDRKEIGHCQPIDIWQLVTGGVCSSQVQLLCLLTPVGLTFCLEALCLVLVAFGMTKDQTPQLYSARFEPDLDIDLGSRHVPPCSAMKLPIFSHILQFWSALAIGLENVHTEGNMHCPLVIGSWGVLWSDTPSHINTHRDLLSVLSRLWHHLPFPANFAKCSSRSTLKQPDSWSAFFTGFGPRTATAGAEWRSRLMQGPSCTWCSTPTAGLWHLGWSCWSITWPSGLPRSTRIYVYSAKGDVKAGNGAPAWARHFGGFWLEYCEDQEHFDGNMLCLPTGPTVNKNWPGCGNSLLFIRQMGNASFTFMFYWSGANSCTTKVGWSMPKSVAPWVLHGFSEIRVLHFIHGSNPHFPPKWPYIRASWTNPSKPINHSYPRSCWWIPSTTHHFGW